MSATSDPNPRRFASHSQQAPPLTASQVLLCDLKPLPERSEGELTRSLETDTARRDIKPMSGPELAVRVNFMTFIRGGATLQEAAAIAGCSVRIIHGWLSTDPYFRQQYHHARWEAESEALEPVRQLATESVQAALYLAEHRRERLSRRANSHADQPLDDILARIEKSLRTMLGGFVAAVESIDNDDIRKQLTSELSRQVEPIDALFRELWQRFEISTT